MASTIKAVAEMAGCSITTVSRAFSTPNRVKPETLEKIQNAAKYYKYSPNAIARAMVMQRNHSIAFVIHEKHYPILLNPFYAAISQAAQEQAETLGYTVYIVSSKTFSQNASTLFIKKRVDGAILAGQYEPSLLDQLSDQGAPIVLVNSPSDRENIVSITVDDYNGTVQAIEHLIEKGHTKIGLVSGMLYPYIQNMRQNAFIDTMAKHELPIYPHYIKSTEPNIEHALAAVNELLELREPPTALFCMNDSIAIGAIKAALRKGLRVPEDLAVVGFDNSSLCTVIEPELTSVSIDTKKMGCDSANALIAMINGEDISEKHIRLDTKLITRQST